MSELDIHRLPYDLKRQPRERTMFNNPGFTLGDQMHWLIELFCQTMAPEACKRRVTWLSVPLWTRARKLRGRFCALYAMWKAGTLPRVRVRAGAVVRPSPRPAGGEGGVRGL